MLGSPWVVEVEAQKFALDLITNSGPHELMGLRSSACPMSWMPVEGLCWVLTFFYGLNGPQVKDSLGTLLRTKESF
jgi:hypothetical protein